MVGEVHGLDDPADRRTVSRRMDQERRADLSKSQPAKFAAQSLPFRLFHGRQDLYEAPVVVPRARGRGIDSPLCGLESGQAGSGDRVVGLASFRGRLEPAVPRETVNAGADQTLADAEMSGQRNQAAEPDGAAPGQDRVAENGDDQGVRPEVELARKRCDRFGGDAGGGIHCLFRRRRGPAFRRSGCRRRAGPCPRNGRRRRVRARSPRRKRRSCP